MATSASGPSQTSAEELGLSITLRPITSRPPRKIYSSCKVTQRFACEVRRQTADVSGDLYTSFKKPVNISQSVCRSLAAFLRPSIVKETGL